MFGRDSAKDQPTTTPTPTAAPSTTTTPAPVVATRVATPPVATRTVTSAGSGASLAGRIALTLLGAAAMIVSAFLDWYRGIAGTNLTVKSLWRTTFSSVGTFTQTVGFVLVVLGLAAIIGLAFRSGWLTRLAGSVGIVVFVLFVIELYRATGPAQVLPGAGAWVAVAASLVTIIGGFLGTRARIVRIPDSDDILRR